jgi:hypothetical protein
MPYKSHAGGINYVVCNIKRKSKRQRQRKRKMKRKR